LNKHFELKDTHKVIILAIILFLLFSDPKVKAYIMNILEVIFGKFLKSQSGGITKIGLAFYSCVFGIALLVCVSFIDLSAIKLNF
jgi:energy-coupling factor transporter transmembrane protein EcfT